LRAAIPLIIEQLRRKESDPFGIEQFGASDSDVSSSSISVLAELAGNGELDSTMFATQLT